MSEYNFGSGEFEGIPASPLDGIVTSYHHDEAGDEWVVRIHHPRGIQSVCGCPGEIEAKMVASALAAVVAVADCTFSIQTGGGEKSEKTEQACQAIDLILDFLA